MKVLVDTTIWSAALRRRQRGASETALVQELAELITELRAVLIGPVRQEVLSGIADQADFESVREHLAAFEDLPLKRQDYEEAARLFTKCRSQGVQGSHIDFLICAVATRHDASVFTTDKDLARYARHLDLTLHQLRVG